MLAVVATCGASVAAVCVLELQGSDAYRSVLGVTHPVALSLVVTTLGLFGIQFMEQRGVITSAMAVRKGWAAGVLIGMLLPIPVIVVDILGGFSPNINILAPDALLFYPSVALIAEIVFHVAPLGGVALIAEIWTKAARRLEAAGVAVAVMVEPVLQVAWSVGHSPPWANAYVGFHLVVFNAVAVYLLRRYGFLGACMLRVSYYMVWHIIWGHIRLDLLFAS